MASEPAAKDPTGSKATTKPGKKAEKKSGEEASGPPAPEQLTRRQGENRPDQQLTLEVFGRPLTIGGEYQVESKFLKDTSFGDDTNELGEEADDEWGLENKLELEFLYQLSETISMFTEVKAGHESDLWLEGETNLSHHRLRDPNDPSPLGLEREQQLELERGEAWLFWQQIGGTGFAVQLGRQPFEEKREWWWDSDLDSARVRWDSERVGLQLGLAQELARTSTSDEFIDPEQEDVLRLISQARWEWAEKQELGAYFLSQHDHSDGYRAGEDFFDPTQPRGDIIDRDREDESDGDLVWFGLGGRGRWEPADAFELHYWWNGGVVTGKETAYDFQYIGGGKSHVDESLSRDVRGRGFDVGMTWETELPLEPRFTLGYAYGSGDRDDEDDTDRSFRQTGLHGNKGKFRGENRFRYYGEALRPELSNLRIFTAGLGFPLLTGSSIELIYHAYRQVNSADFLRDSDIDFDPYGLDHDIGQELDLVLGFEEWERLEIELTYAVFRAGKAYRSPGLDPDHPEEPPDPDHEGDLAHRIALKFEYPF